MIFFFFCVWSNLITSKNKPPNWIVSGFLGKEKMAKTTGALSGANLELLWKRYASLNTVKHEIHN